MIKSDDVIVKMPAGQSHDENETTPSHDSAAILVYTTFPSLSEAKKAAHALIAKGIAACVNLIEHMTAVYIWEGKVEEDSEVAMIIKTTQARREAVLEEIKRLHPFSTPARLVLPVIGGGQDFLSWIESQCRHRQGIKPDI